jgi:hypothetical protein
MESRSRRGTALLSINSFLSGERIPALGWAPCTTPSPVSASEQARQPLTTCRSEIDWIFDFAESEKKGACGTRTRPSRPRRSRHSFPAPTGRRRVLRGSQPNEHTWPEKLRMPVAFLGSLGLFHRPPVSQTAATIAEMPRNRGIPRNWPSTKSTEFEVA